MVQIRKQGVAEGVDWIIAAGIFLIYLGLVFVFFKPGVKPIYDYEELGRIVETNIKKELIWNMTRTPVFTKTIKFKDGGSTIPAAIGEKLMRFKDLGKNIDLDPINAVSVLGIPKPYFRENGDFCIEKVLYTGGYTPLVLYNSPTASSSITCPTTIQPQDTACSKEELDTDTRLEDGEFNEGDTSSLCGAIYKIGSPEYLEGIDFGKISIQNSRYNDLRKIWNFPPDKEFKILFYSTKNLECKDFAMAKADQDCFINPTEPPENANVFVQEVSLYALDDSGTLTPYTMNIRIW